MPHKCVLCGKGAIQPPDQRDSLVNIGKWVYWVPTLSKLCYAHAQRLVRRIEHQREIENGGRDYGVMKRDPITDDEWIAALSWFVEICAERRKKGKTLLMCEGNGGCFCFGDHIRDGHRFCGRHAYPIDTFHGGHIPCQSDYEIAVIDKLTELFELVEST